MSFGRQQLCLPSSPLDKSNNTAVYELELLVLVRKAGRSSQENCTQRSVGQFFLTQFAEPDLGSRFEQAELSLRQGHFGTNLVLGLFEHVETRQDLAIALG